MKRKKITSVVALILVLLMVVSLIVSVLPVSAYAINQEEIDNIQQQKDYLSNRVQECQNRIDLLKKEQANVLEQKAALDEQNRVANEQLALIDEEIAMYKGLVEEKEEELREAEKAEEKQLDRYRTRVRAMEENGGFNILALVLNCENFSEFLTAVDDMGEIMESDKKLEQECIEARELSEEKLADYESALADYEAKYEELKSEQAAIEQQISDAYDTLAELEEEIERAIAEYKAAEAAEAAAAATIINMIAAYNAQKRQEALQQQQQQVQPQQPQGGSDNTGSTGGDNGSSGNTDNSGSDNSSAGNTDNSGSSGDTGSNDSSNSGASEPSYSTGGTGSLIWPVPCSIRVTSRFGYRSDPFTGEQRFHSGIDIDGFNNDGNIIVASDGGTVITAAYDAGYGNYVIIDHGNYTQTLYAHMSGFAVSYGDYVYQGQTVGYLGSTGRSTGTHLHYEVFVNGGRVDPTAYFSGISYWNC